MVHNSFTKTFLSLIYSKEKNIPPAYKRKFQMLNKRRKEA